MPVDVFLTADAERGLEAIHDFVAQSHSTAAADRVLDRLVAVALALAEFPERGGHPRELTDPGFGEYRQIMFKPWRLIYRVIGQAIVIYLVADGRRNMQSLLSDRLLAAD